MEGGGKLGWARLGMQPLFSSKKEAGDPKISRL